MALRDRKIRVSKETLLEQIEVCLILLVLWRGIHKREMHHSIDRIEYN